MKTACTFYTYDSVQDTYNPITKVAKGELMEKTQPYYKTTQQYSLNYKNTFNDLHDVEALALWEWKETNTNWFMARRYYSTTSAIPERRIEVTWIICIMKETLRSINMAV